jgi:hypothetical protein
MAGPLGQAGVVAGVGRTCVSRAGGPTLVKIFGLIVSFGEAGRNLLITTEEQPAMPPGALSDFTGSAHQGMTGHGP